MRCIAPSTKFEHASIALSIAADVTRIISVPSEATRAAIDLADDLDSFSGD